METLTNQTSIHHQFAKNCGLLVHMQQIEVMCTVGTLKTVFLFLFFFLTVVTNITVNQQKKKERQRQKKCYRNPKTLYSVKPTDIYHSLLFKVN